MKNFNIGQFDHSPIVDDDYWELILGKILAKFQLFNVRWNMTIQLPYKMGSEEVITGTKTRKTLLRKIKTEEIKKYHLYLYFNEDLSSQDMAAWNMFILGMRAGQLI